MAGIIYLLDSNICIAIMKHENSPARHKAELFEPGELYICPTVKGEMYFGAYKSKWLDKNLAALEEFFSKFSLLPITTEVSKQYGQIRAELTKQGQIIGPNDLWIAATAIAHRAVLVTHNTKEFQRVKGLHLEDWL